MGLYRSAPSFATPEVARLSPSLLPDTTRCAPEASRQHRFGGVRAVSLFTSRYSSLSNPAQIAMDLPHKTPFASAIQLALHNAALSGSPRSLLPMRLWPSRLCCLRRRACSEPLTVGFCHLSTRTELHKSTTEPGLLVSFCRLAASYSTGLRSRSRNPMGYLLTMRRPYKTLRHSQRITTYCPSSPLAH